MDETYELEHNGIEFTYGVSRDYRSPPWEEYDGHGVVLYANRDKKPSEVIIGGDRRGKWLYDIAATQKIAISDGWGSGGAKEAAIQVQNDIEFCRKFLNDDICWMWISVCPTGSPDEYETLGGILSEWNDKYVVECVEELADQILYSRAKKHAEAEAFYLGM